MVVVVVVVVMLRLTAGAAFRLNVRIFINLSSRHFTPHKSSSSRSSQ